MSKFIGGEVSRIEEDRLIVKTDERNEIRCILSDRMALGKWVLLCIRPEDFELHANPPKEDVNVLEIASVIWATVCQGLTPFTLACVGFSLKRSESMFGV